MFGPRLDYWLLRPIVRRPALGPVAPGPAPDATVGGLRLRKFNKRLAGGIPLAEGLRYLDAGCGRGDMAVALAQASGGFVKGVDVNPASVGAARRLLASTSLDPAKVEFECADVLALRESGEKFDVVVSHEALEHYADPEAFLATCFELLKDDGSRLVAGFGPLFRAPLNTHVDYMFKFPIPWAALLFSETALLRLRSEFHRPNDPAARWEDIKGGLNRMRYSQFLHWVGCCGFTTERLVVNLQLKRWPPLWAVSSALVRLPVLRDYFATSVYGVFRPSRTGA